MDSLFGDAPTGKYQRSGPQRNGFTLKATLLLLLDWLGRLGRTDWSRSVIFGGCHGRENRHSLTNCWHSFGAPSSPQSAYTRVNGGIKSAC